MFPTIHAIMGTQDNSGYVPEPPPVPIGCAYPLDCTESDLPPPGEPDLPGLLTKDGTSQVFTYEVFSDGVDTIENLSPPRVAFPAGAPGMGPPIEGANYLSVYENKVTCYKFSITVPENYVIPAGWEATSTIVTASVYIYFINLVTADRVVRQVEYSVIAQGTAPQLKLTVYDEFGDKLIEDIVDSIQATLTFVVGSNSLAIFDQLGLLVHVPNITVANAARFPLVSVSSLPADTDFEVVGDSQVRIELLTSVEAIGKVPVENAVTICGETLPYYDPDLQDVYWEPNTQYTLSEDKLTVTSPPGATRGCCIANIDRHNNGYYFEVEVLEYTVSGEYAAIGVIPYEGELIADSGAGVGVVNNMGVGYQTTGNILVEGALVGAGESYTAGDVIGVLISPQKLRISFYKNGVIQADVEELADLFLNTWGLFPAVNTHKGSVHKGLFTEADMLYYPPVSTHTNPLPWNHLPIPV